MAKCPTCSAPVNLAPDGDPKYEPPWQPRPRLVPFRLWGWFDEAGQTEATYDPPHDAPCPYCLAPITPIDVRTHSIMYQDAAYAKRSYFYRTHRTCAQDARVRGDESMDGRIFDAIEKAGD